MSLAEDTPLEPRPPLDSAGDRLFADALERLPMFPLPGVVLFPHALLPLHIFEERYKKMARDLLASHRHLAVALLEPDGDRAASGERPAVRPTMGAGEIVMAHELPGASTWWSGGA